MAITGGIKFFEPSMNLGANGATISASSGDSSASMAIDRNPDTRWISVSSNDLTTETITITFDEDKDISRLLLLDHNFKGYTIQYDNGGTWTHFSSVVGLDGALANLTETAFADDSSYYEFAEVTTGSIRLQVTATQTADAEKYIAQIIATSELGTLVGFPVVKDVEVDRNSRVKKTLSGRYLIQKSIETASISLNFKDYPSQAAYNADIDLMMDLFDREDPFIVWLCGGKRGTNYFRYTLRGYRLRDAYLMQISKQFKLGYMNNTYTNPVNVKVELEEHI